MDALTEEKFKNLDEKIDQLIEGQKHTNGIVEEVRDLEATNATKVDRTNKELETVNDILWNGGKNGLVMRVDRLEGKFEAMKKAIEEYKKSKSERLAYAIAIASIITSIVTAIWK